MRQFPLFVFVCRILRLELEKIPNNLQKTEKIYAIIVSDRTWRRC